MCKFFISFGVIILIISLLIAEKIWFAPAIGIFVLLLIVYTVLINKPNKRLH